MAMAEEKRPFEIPCFDLNKPLQPNVFDLNKKRKFQADQLGLPFPKHLCGNRSPGSVSVDSIEMGSEIFNPLSCSSSFGEGESPSKEFHLHDSPSFNETIVELEHLMNSNNDESSKQFVLSSGRWDVNQKNSMEGLRKPTIDQEFEEYFSMLML